MAKKVKRFIATEQQSGFATGATVLVDAAGNPIVTPITEE